MYKPQTVRFSTASITSAFLILSLTACDTSARLDGIAPQIVPVAMAVDDDTVDTSAVPVTVVDQSAVNTETANETVPGDPLMPVSVKAYLQDIVTNKGVFRLMSMGDSITQGVGGAGSYRVELNNLMQSAGCPVKLVGSQSSSNPDVGFYGAHEGYSGHTTADFLVGRAANRGAAFNVDYHRADIVLLHIGSADIFAGRTVEDALAGVDSVIASIQSAKPGTFVLLANIVPRMDVGSGAEKPVLIAELGDRIEQYVAASGNPLLQLVDVRSGFNAEMFLGDLVHPNATGDAHVADAFFGHVHSSSYCSG